MKTETTCCERYKSLFKNSFVRTPTICPIIKFSPYSSPTETTLQPSGFSKMRFRKNEVTVEYSDRKCHNFKFAVTMDQFKSMKDKNIAKKFKFGDNVIFLIYETQKSNTLTSQSYKMMCDIVDVCFNEHLFSGQIDKKLSDAYIFLATSDLLNDCFELRKHKLLDKVYTEMRIRKLNLPSLPQECCMNN